MRAGRKKLLGNSYSKLTFSVFYSIMLLWNLPVGRQGIVPACHLCSDFDWRLQIKGKKCLIPRIELHSLEDNLPFIMSRRQFPVHLCFAMTVKKPQGQLWSTILNLLPWLYVVLSRATDVRRLMVLLPETRTTTANVLYPKVLEDIQRLWRSHGGSSLQNMSPLPRYVCII